MTRLALYLAALTLCAACGTALALLLFGCCAEPVVNLGPDQKCYAPTMAACEHCDEWTLVEVPCQTRRRGDG